MRVNLSLQQRFLCSPVLLLFCSLLFLFFIPAHGQLRNQQIQQLSILGSDGAYRLGPGDMIEIKVFGVDQFNQLVNVSPAGTIELPLLGSVQASGLTTTELAHNIRGLLLAKELIQDPQVTVLVKEYRSQSVLVLGMVNQPGQYHMSEQLRLIDALAMAGGLKEVKAGDSVIIQRRDPIQNSDGEPKTIKVSLRELLEKGDSDLNVAVRNGDVINVPERTVHLFYVMGDVNRPGAFELPATGELTLTQAVAWAGGHMKTAKLSDGLLLRHGADGKRKEEIALNYDRILKGKDPDLDVHPNDIIFIPGSTVKSLWYGLIGAIPRTIPRAVVDAPLR